MIRHGAISLCMLLLALAPAWGQDVAQIMASDPARYTAKDLPLLMEAQAKAEASGNTRAVQYLVTLRVVAQLQDTRHGALETREGIPLPRSQVEADLQRLTRRLAELRRPATSTTPLTATRNVEAKPLGEFFNRELSFLEFNRRVVSMAADANQPLMERVKFLSIASANLDEFFSIRVSGLHQDALNGNGAARSDGNTPRETLAAIDREARALEAEQQRLWESLKVELGRQGIEIVNPKTANQALWTQIESKLQEVHQHTRTESQPQLRNGQAQLMFQLPDGSQRFLQMTDKLPTWIEIPGANGKVRMVRTQEALVSHYERQWKARGGVVRLTTNQDLWGREGVAGHRYNTAVRIETDLPRDMREGLAQRLGLRAEDVYRQRQVGLAGAGDLSDRVERTELRFPAFTPNTTNPFENGVFARIRAGDVLLHHPYDKFDRVVEWLKAASTDAKVEEIRISLYRTGMNSSVVEALEAAAQNGKKVTVLVELKARFDERANVSNTDRLKAAGVEVVHGAHGHKVHAKIAQVVRREHGRLVHYSHLGTGNYHPGSSRFYTDLALLTVDAEIGRDVQRIFEQLTGKTQGAPRLSAVLQAPYTLQSSVIEMINAEAQNAREGKPARIVAKMNSLNDPKIIRALYQASQAGVQIDLIVRGLCTLRPGVAGLSETIRVRSTLGQFLEHSRVYQFHANGQLKTYIASADWMSRNTTRRVETAAPIKDPAIKAKLDALLRTYLRDTAGSFMLRPDGSYERLRVEPGVVASKAQEEVRQRMAEAPPLPSAEAVAKAPVNWQGDLRMLDEALRTRHGVGLNVIENSASRFGMLKSSPGVVTITTGMLEQIHQQALSQEARASERAEIRRVLLAQKLELLMAKKRGGEANARALVEAGRMSMRANGEARTLAASEAAANRAMGELLARYRRPDKSLNWKALRADAASHTILAAGKFTLAIFLQEFGYALASRDPLRLEEFFEAVATTDFYVEYGLFVVGATAGQASYSLAYKQYLRPYLKQGLFHQVLKSQISLAAGLALPQIVHGTFETKRFVISLSSLGISSMAVHGAMSRIPWVKKVNSATSGLLRKTGWVYQAAELAIVLTVSSELEQWVHGKLDRRAAKAALAEAGETVVRDLKAATTEAEREEALKVYGEAWEHYRVFLYTPLFAAQAKLQRRLEPVLEDAKIDADNASEALSRLDRVGKLREIMEAYAEEQGDNLDTERLETAIRVFNEEFADGLQEVYEDNRREDAFPLPTGAMGAPGSPLGVFGRGFSRAHRDVSDNRLQTYEDQRAALAALARWLGERDGVATVGADALVGELAADDAKFFGENSTLRTGMTDGLRPAGGGPR